MVRSVTQDRRDRGQTHYVVKDDAASTWLCSTSALFLTSGLHKAAVTTEDPPVLLLYPP